MNDKRVREYPYNEPFEFERDRWKMSEEEKMSG